MGSSVSEAKAVSTDASGATGAMPMGDARDTSNYRKHTSGNPLQRRLIERFHRTIADRVAALSPATFLDAGCGEGFVAEVLLDRLPGLAVTGFDFNPASVELARARAPRATFETASIFEIPHEANSFEVVGCFEVLEHQDDPAAALRELARVASRAVIVSVPHEPFFSLANAARGKNLGVRPRGSDPDHRQLWRRAAFGDFVRRDPTLDVVWLGGSFPWTICVARKRGGA
jgi:SAM-dependent methyltransferase